MMGPYLEDHVLTVVVFLPLATALGLLLSSMLASFLLRSDGLPPTVWRAIGMGSATLTFLLSVIAVWGGFDPEASGYQLLEHEPWLAQYGINYFVGIDGISLVLVMLTTFLTPVTLLAAWNDIKISLRSFIFFMLFLETGMLGAFVSLNLFQFYVFWEVMLVPMYFIIGIWGGPRRVYAAVKFFLFTMVGSLLMLVAMLVLYRLNFEQGGMLNLDLVKAPGNMALSMMETAVPVLASAEHPWWQTQYWLFAAFALAFAIKVPMVPFHTWLPDAHVEAPTPGSVILAGVLLKMGTYGFVRFALPLFPSAADDFTLLMFVLALIGIVYGSLVAMVQPDVKKLVAYSSVAHMGFIVLGIFALNVQGLTGAVVQMVNHGLSTGALFVLVGFIYLRRHTRMISDFGGLARPMPVYAALFGIVVMSSIGLPSLNGFVGEFLILLGTFGADRWVAVIATSGVILAAVYMLWMYRRVMFGPLTEAENRGLIDLDLREKAVMVALILPIIWIGLYPHPLLRRIEPAVSGLLQDMERRQVLSQATFGPADAGVPAAVQGEEPGAAHPEALPEGSPPSEAAKPEVGPEHAEPPAVEGDSEGAREGHGPGVVAEPGAPSAATGGGGIGRIG
jgi:NADH-quinone oxidoreductase subunit M